jgi:hypothetical protein
VARAESGRGGEVRQLGVFENQPELLTEEGLCDFVAGDLHESAPPDFWLRDDQAGQP